MKKRVESQTALIFVLILYTCVYLPQPNAYSQIESFGNSSTDPCTILLLKLESILGRKGDVPTLDGSSKIPKGSTTRNGIGLSAKEIRNIEVEITRLQKRRSEHSSGSRDYFEDLSRYLDLINLAPGTGKNPTLKYDPKFLPSQNDVATFAKAKSAWEMSKALSVSDKVVGFSSFEGKWTLFIKGTERLHAITHNGKLLPRSKVLAEYNRICRQEVERYTSKGLRLIELHAFEQGYEVRFPGKIKPTFLTIEEFRQFINHELRPDHPLIKKIRMVSTAPTVVYSNPLMKKPGRHLDDQRRFSFEAKKYSSHDNFFRDPLSDQTLSNLESLDGLRVFNKNLFAIVASESLKNDEKPNDWKLVANMKKQLGREGVGIIDFQEGKEIKWSHGENNGVLVITGHSDEKLRNFVRMLGRSGALKGNAVVFNTCETRLTDSMMLEITSRFGAMGVYQTAGRKEDGKVTVYEVHSFVEELVGQLKKDEKMNFSRLINRASKLSKTSGIWSICRLVIPLKFLAGTTCEGSKSKSFAGWRT